MMPTMVRWTLRAGLGAFYFLRFPCFPLSSTDSSIALAAREV